MPEFNQFDKRRVQPPAEPSLGELFCSIVSESAAHELQDARTLQYEPLVSLLEYTSPYATVSHSVTLPPEPSVWDSINPLTLIRNTVDRFAPSLRDWHFFSPAPRKYGFGMVGHVQWHPLVDRIAHVVSPDEIAVLVLRPNRANTSFGEGRFPAHEDGGSDGEQQTSPTTNIGRSLGGARVSSLGLADGEQLQAIEEVELSEPLVVYQHEFQRDVSALAWKPFSGTVLAVGCLNGICVWGGGGKRGRMPLMSFLSTRSGRVNAVDWSPCGLKLVSASENEDGFVVWDMSSETPTRIMRAGRTSCVSWSPNGLYMLQGTTSTTARIWETETWTCEKWSCPAPAKGATWSCDSSSCLLSYEQCSFVQCLELPPGQTPPDIGADITRPPIDLGPYNVAIEGSEMQLGGSIQRVAWDPKSRRLAISLPPTDEGLALIALFATKMPGFNLVPIGFLRGEITRGQVIDMKFKPSFENGALLAVSWEDGSIVFWPLCWTK